MSGLAIVLWGVVIIAGYSAKAYWPTVPKYWLGFAIGLTAISVLMLGEKNANRAGWVPIR